MLPPINLKVNAQGAESYEAWRNVPGTVVGYVTAAQFLVWVSVGEMQPNREYRFEIDNVPGTYPVAATLNEWDAGSGRPTMSPCVFVTLSVNRGPNVLRVSGSHDGPGPLRAAVGMLVPVAVE